MIETTSATRSIVVERTMRHAPEKIWRALTQSSLMAEWLMQNDFEARLGGHFTFRARPMGNWNGLVQCEITTFEPPHRLIYTWKGGSTGPDTHFPLLDSVVEWTLTPVADGTRVRMEHSGFGSQHQVAYDAMSGGWQRMLERLESVMAQRT